MPKIWVCRGPLNTDSRRQAPVTICEEVLQADSLLPCTKLMFCMSTERDCVCIRVYSHFTLDPPQSIHSAVYWNRITVFYRVIHGAILSEVFICNRKMILLTRYRANSSELNKL